MTNINLNTPIIAPKALAAEPITTQGQCGQYMLHMILQMLDVAHDFGWERTARELDLCALALADELTKSAGEDAVASVILE